MQRLDVMALNLRVEKDLSAEHEYNSKPRLNILNFIKNVPAAKRTL